MKITIDKSIGLNAYAVNTELGYYTICRDHNGWCIDAVCSISPEFSGESYSDVLESWKMVAPSIA